MVPFGSNFKFACSENYPTGLPVKSRINGKIIVRIGCTANKCELAKDMEEHEYQAGDQVVSRGGWLFRGRVCDM